MRFAPASDADGTVRVCGLVTGRPVGEPLTGHTSAVQAVAVGEVHGRAVAVSGGYDGTVRMWDPAAGRPVARVELDASVKAIACHGAIVVTATDRGLVALRLTSLLATR
ncbi:MAG: hypothetical protein ACRDYA_00010 [Egibacteraceae bacterium]